jgi:Leucine-rich repeat (LRR) protein
MGRRLFGGTSAGAALKLSPAALCLHTYTQTHAGLQQLDLGANYIIGTLPRSLGNLMQLRALNLGKNGWTDIGQGAAGRPLLFCKRHERLESPDLT